MPPVQKDCVLTEKKSLAKPTVGGRIVVLLTVIECMALFAVLMGGNTTAICAGAPLGAGLGVAIAQRLGMWPKKQ